MSLQPDWGRKDQTDWTQVSSCGYNLFWAKRYELQAKVSYDVS